MMTFRGWICGDKEDAKLLESLGVIVGAYDDAFGTFEDCFASDKALANLSVHWGKFVWHLVPFQPCTVMKDVA